MNRSLTSRRPLLREAVHLLRATAAAAVVTGFLIVVAHAVSA